MVAQAPTNVLESLHALMHQIRRATQDSGAGQEGALAPMDARALGFFARHPGGTASELVEHAGRDKAQIARVLKRLQERGLLMAEPSPHDQRSIQLRLTEAGRETARKQQQRRKRLESQWLSGFNEAERHQLGAYLDRLRAAVGGEGARPPAREGARRAKAE